MRIEDDRRTSFSLSDPEAYDIICQRRAPAEAGLRSSGLSRADRQDQRHVGFTPRDSAPERRLRRFKVS